ncbi:unnamed protein product [Parnassius mnemosyne]|uniref:Uncharacterized protein n=1 Tax=Parnassius mnemosyne TaxID=213953 RepID=A0AAV1LZZ0_9NEOP
MKNLNITKRFVYCNIKRYSEDCSVDDRSRSVRPRSVSTPAVIKALTIYYSWKCNRKILYMIVTILPVNHYCPTLS